MNPIAMNEPNPNPAFPTLSPDLMRFFFVVCLFLLVMPVKYKEESKQEKGKPSDYDADLTFMK